MSRRIVSASFIVAVVVFACGGLTDAPRPGDSMAKLCEAAHALADATALSEASIASGSGNAADGRAAADLAGQADTRRQNAMGLASWARQLEDALDPPGSPGFGDRMREIDAAQHAIDLLVGGLGSPADPVTLEARPRLLASARDAVAAIALPAECTAIEAPSPLP